MVRYQNFSKIFAQTLQIVKAARLALLNFIRNGLEFIHGA